MNRTELLHSKEYWVTDIQLRLFETISKYLEENNLSRQEFAENLKVSKGYISQILNGDFDHKISKLVELSLAAGKIPKISFQDIDDFIGDEICGLRYANKPLSVKISNERTNEKSKHTYNYKNQFVLPNY